jgi:eukaryotic translation initiation factor 2C
MIIDIKGMVIERLQHFCQHNCSQVLPSNILLYRNGVSESQYTELMTLETPQITAARQQQLSQGYVSRNNLSKPRVTVIIVSKRHNTRFYATRMQDMVGWDSRTGGLKEDKAAWVTNTNLRPGLLVDTAITMPHLNNFYLHSHDAIKGMTKSTHYVVLQDDINLNKNSIYKIVSQPHRVPISSNTKRLTF